MEKIRRTDTVALMQLRRKFGSSRIVRIVYEYWIGTLKQQLTRIWYCYKVPPAIVYKPPSYLEKFFISMIDNYIPFKKYKILNEIVL